MDCRNDLIDRVLKGQDYWDKIIRTYKTEVIFALVYACVVGIGINILHFILVKISLFLFHF